jgi:hypothetical protein
MSKPFGEVIQLIANKSGLDTSELTDLFQVKAEVSEETFQKIEGSLSQLLSLQDAKNNPDLHKHFKALSLNPFDKLLNEVLESGSIDEDVVNELKANPNTYDRAKKLIAKIAESKPASKADKDIEPLKAKIAELNNQVLKQREDYENKINSIAEENKTSLINYQIDSLLSSKEFANSDLPKDVNILTAKTLLEKELREKNAKIVLGEKGLKLVNAETPELDFTDSNKTVGFEDLVTKVLATNKLLKVSQGATPQPQTPQQQIQITPDVDNPAGIRNAERLARLEEATKA